MLWTYAVPVIPLACLWDGMISVLRIYSPEELQARYEFACLIAAPAASPAPIAEAEAPAAEEPATAGEDREARSSRRRSSCRQPPAYAARRTVGKAHLQRCYQSASSR